MAKIIDDTLKNKYGKYSRKSLTSFASFILGVSYEFVLPFLGLPTKEYVFITLLSVTIASLGLTVWDKNSKDSEV